jgi:hypothetical protein
MDSEEAEDNNPPEVSPRSNPPPLTTFDDAANAAAIALFTGLLFDGKIAVTSAE